MGGANELLQPTGNERNSNVHGGQILEQGDQSGHYDFDMNPDYFD